MRWLPRRRRDRGPAPVLVDDDSLVVLGTSRDPARSDSAVVAEMTARGVDVTRPLLVRHLLLLPGPDAVAHAARLLGSDGYSLRTEPTPDASPDPALDPALDPPRRPGDPTAGRVEVRASRTQLVTGLSLAQERTRMAGLAARLGGDVEGWEVCGPGGSPGDR